jgi:hypothetical protein
MHQLDNSFLKLLRHNVHHEHNSRAFQIRSNLVKKWSGRHNENPSVLPTDFLVSIQLVACAVLVFALSFETVACGGVVDDSHSSAL